MSHYTFRRIGGGDQESLTRQINEEFRRIGHAFVEGAGERGRVLITGATYTVQAHDYLIAVNRAGAVTITLPDGSGEGGFALQPQEILVVDESGLAGTNVITIAGNGNNINGAGSVAISSNYGITKLYFNGSEWFIIG